MPVDYKAVQELTGLDLEDTAKLRKELAVTWVAELGFPIAGVVDAARGVYEETIRQVMALKPVAAVAKPLAQVAAALGPITVVVGSWKAIIDSLAADMKEKDGINLRRIIAARDTSIMSTYKVGDWWTQTRIHAPTDPILTKPYKMSLADFEGQVSPRGVVVSMARGNLKRDILRPSYPTTGVNWGPVDRFNCFGGEQTLVRQLPTIPSYKMAKDAANCMHSDTQSCRFEEDEGTPNWIRKVMRWTCVPFDVSTGCSVPPGWWLYCLGAAPDWGWLGQALPFSPAAAVVAAAIKTPTPIHLAITERTVRESLLAILDRTHVLEYPEDPGQSKNGIFREKGGTNLVIRGGDPGEPFDGWSTKSRLVAGELSLDVPGARLIRIINAHRDWLAMRRALLLTMADQRPELVEAARKSPDPEVRAAAEGRSPTTYYSRLDPLGLLRAAAPRRGRRQGRQRDSGGDRFAAPDLGHGPSRWPYYAGLAAAGGGLAWWLRRRA